MAFPFPQNPVDGQTVSHLAADGSLLKATYSATKNCWNVERAIHQSPILLSRAGVSIPTATADKQVMMWDATANQWVASTIALSTKDLADVDKTTTPADQYFLLFDAALNKYKPVPLTGGAVLTATTVGLNNQIGTGTVSAALTALFKVARPASNPKGGDAYIVTPVRTNSALDKLSGTYLYDGTNWVRAANDSGGAAAHYRATSATPQEPGSKIGDLDILNELNNHQLNAYDGTNYQTVFSEQAIKQWIAAGSLFQGTLKTDPDLTALPAAGPSNRGFYWTWTGAPSHVVTNPIAVTLQVGDWIQSDGTRYIHVPSDLMSKQRWSSVGSFRTWSNTDYELDTLIYHNFKLYRATSAIVTGDVEPGAAGSKWQELQIKLSIEELSNVNDNASAYGQDCILVWDEANQEWTASRTLEIDAIEFDESGPATLMTGIAASSLTLTNPTANPEQWVPSVYAVKEAISSIALQNLDDTKQLAFAGDGEVVSYNATLNRWEAKAPGIASLADIGDVNIATVPTNNQALTWDAATSRWIPKLAASSVATLTDVHITSEPVTGESLVYNNITHKWSAGSPHANMPEWSSTTSYRAGDAVHHEGRLWRALPNVVANTNKTPEIILGSVLAFWKTVSKSVGPVAVEEISNGDPNVAPLTVPTGFGQHPHLIYRSDTDYSIWIWGVDPVTRVRAWVKAATSFVPAWRHIALPTPNLAVGQGQVWIYTLPGSVTAPVVPQQFWEPLAIGDFLVSLADVDVKAATEGQVLSFDSRNYKWKPTTPVDAYSKTQSYSRTETDALFTQLVLGLEHEVSVLAITPTPPPTPGNGDIYIVGPGATGAWVGHTNELARWDGAAWVFEAPSSREAHLVEDVTATYSWSGTAWVKVASASTASATGGELWQVGSVQQSLLTETQWASVLGAEATKWVLADGRNVAGSKYATVTGQANVPDLRGAFIRAAGQNSNSFTNWNGGTVGASHGDTTRLPRNTAFTGVTNTTGNHHHYINLHQSSGSGGTTWDGGNKGGQSNNTGDAGDHSHTVTINGGGDVETAPVHYGLNTFIKIN